jgi:nitrite reductase/ring-hydroxylating ferredoxin subunit
MHDTAEQPEVDTAGCTSGAGPCAHALSRRGLLRTAAVAGTVATAGVGLSACSSMFGSTDSSAAGSADTSMPSSAPSTASSPAQMATTQAAMSSAPAETHASGTLLGHSSEIPVGGGVIFSDHQVVVTQPSAGTYKAFSTVCTHAGCQCNQVSSGQINCPCHGAAFSISDGSAVQGPAHSPLASKTITVQNGEIRLQA